MKNLLKKLGVFVLLISILLPFVELPVKAASENCKSYLQNYLFMHTGGATEVYHDLMNLTKEKEGYRTFASFVYDFPTLSDGQTLTIESVERDDLTEDGELRTFYNYFVKLARENATSEVLQEISDYGNVKYSNEDMHTGITSSSYLLHGKWYTVDENGTLNNGVYISGDAETYLFQENLDDRFQAFYDSSYQGYVLSSGKGTALTNTFSGAKFGGNNYVLASDYGNNKLVSYFQNIVDDVNAGLANTDSNENGYVWIDNDKKYISLSINRSLNEEVLKTYVFSRKSDEKEYIFSTSATEVKDSYVAYENWFSGKKNNNTKCQINGVENADAITTCYWIEKTGNYADIKTINTSGIEYNNSIDGVPTSDLPKLNYYFPYVLGVKYNVCSPAETDTWTLKYDANTDDVNVTKIPSEQTANVNEAIKLSEGPVRDNYKFVKWCLNSDGSGECFDPAFEFKSTESTTVTLYAQWAKTGTTDNKDTGIGTYILSFVAVGVIASGIYLIVRKKNLFGQI